MQAVGAIQILYYNNNYNNITRKCVHNGQKRHMNYELDSGRLYVGVSIDTQRKLEDAASYLCTIFMELDMPEFLLPPTDVSLSTLSYVGCIFTLAARGASVDLRIEYVNELDTPIHECTCARYAVYVRLTSGVKLSQPMLRYGRRNSRRILRRLRKSYVNGAGRSERSKALSRRFLGSICDVILSMRAHAP